MAKATAKNAAKAVHASPERQQPLCTQLVPPPPRTPLVSAVVLNWNGLADTRECLHSLLQQSWPALEIHVVDNASQNDEADRLAEEFDGHIRLHRNTANLGFAGGNNTALHTILAEGRADYVALLNNDAVAEPSWIEALVAAAEADGGVGLCASKMLFYDAPERIENAGIWLLSNGDAVPRGRGQPHHRFSEPADLLGACAGAALLRTSMLRQLGLFRDEFFANFEDVDLSLRAIATGWRCRYVPAARVRHRLNRSIAKVRNEDFHVRSLRNLGCACWINLPWQVLLLDLPWMLLRDALVVTLAPLFGQAGVGRIVRRARRQTLALRHWVRAERRQLRPQRRGSWLRIWLRQRNFLPAYMRFFREAVLLRQRGFLE